MSGNGEPIKEPKSRNTNGETSHIASGLKSYCWIIIFVSGMVLGIVYALPSPIDPIAMNVGGIKAKSFGGNSDLRNVIKLFEGELKGPEGFAVDRDGYIYTGLHDGRIVRFNDSRSSMFAEVTRLGSPPYDNCGTLNAEAHCGRVLGLEISPIDPYLLYICDCYHGISTLNVKTGERDVLVNTSDINIEIPPIKFANDIVILQNGSIYFTDSSYKFHRTELMLEIFEGRPNGKLLHYNPSDNTLTVVIQQLYFANGLSANHDESYLVIAETTRARILKYHLKGPKKGQVETFVDEMPGLPDNISPSARGGFWVGFGNVRTPVDMTLSRYPWIRNILAKLRVHRMIAEFVPRSGLIIEYDENGTILRELYDMGAKRVKSVSEIFDLGNVLYLGSYEHNFIGKLYL